MKIGIDASRAFLRERTGTEEYSYQLIKNLTKINDPFCQFFLYVGKECYIDIPLPGNFKIKKIDHARGWTQIGLSLEILFHPVDVLFVPSHSIPFMHPKNTVVTIHGLEYRNYPECYSLKERLLMELNTMFSLWQAKKIVTPSESTKKDLIKFYRSDPEKINVVYHGVERPKFIKPKIQKDEFDILFIGRIEKRKNILNLIKAFEIFKESYGLKTKSYKLILAGRSGFGSGEIEKAIFVSPDRGDIILKGYVSQNEKEHLYDNARVFVFPSFAEGFGLPILEAQCRNVPVICSNIPPFNEIGKDSVLYFNPADPQDMAVKIENIFEDEELRASLIKKGEDNVRKFDWNRSADETLKIIASI